MGATAQTCAVCEGPLGAELMVITQPDRFERYLGVLAAGYRRAWVDCPRCGTVTDLLPPEIRQGLDGLGTAYYEIDFKGSSLAEKYHKVMGLPPERSDNALRVRRVLDALLEWRRSAGGTGPGRVLDIGAGLGVFLSRFLKEAPAGWAGTAFEPDPLAAAHLRALDAFTVIPEPFPGPAGSGRFDLVTLNKVLEHVAEPVAFLEQVAGALDPEAGLLHVEVPDRLTVFHHPPADNILGALHCHLYGLRGLALALERAGLEVLRVERVFEPSGKISVFAFAARPETVAAAARREPSP